MSITEQERIAQIAQILSKYNKISKEDLAEYGCSEDGANHFLASHHGEDLIKTPVGLLGLDDSQRNAAKVNNEHNDKVTNYVTYGTIAIPALAVSGVLGLAAAAEGATAVAVFEEASVTSLAGGAFGAIFTPITKQIAEPFLHHPTTDEIKTSSLRSAYMEVCDGHNGNLEAPTIAAKQPKYITKNVTDR